jgi:hypothetical protein
VQVLVPQKHAALLPECQALLGGPLRPNVPVTTPLARMLRLFLRNDSFLDLGNRRDVYFALMVRPVCSRPATALIFIG